MNNKFVGSIENIKKSDGSHLTNNELQEILSNTKFYLKRKRSHREDITTTIKNSILSLAIGDALGVPYEFKYRHICKEQVKETMEEYGTHDMPAGTWSDDTSMTIATIDSIIENKSIDINSIADDFCKWLYDHEYTATGRVFDCGRTTMDALEKYHQGNIDAEKVGGTEIHNNGNGSLMRILPVSLYLYFAKYDNAEVNEIISKVSSITHGHNISKCACFIYTIFVHLLLDGYTKETAYYLLRQFDFSKYYDEDVLKNFYRILKNDITSLNEDSIRSTGYVVDTLEASIWLLMKYNTYKDTLIEAVKLGQDTDTIGAITGSMTGIIYNSNDIPLEWKNSLQRYDYIEDVSIYYADYLKHMNDYKYENSSIKK